jgi:hypothetical protein
MVEGRGAYRVLMGKPEGKSPLERPRRRWEYNTSIKMACTGFWWGNLRESDHWGDPGVDRKIILRWIFRK